MVWTMKLGTVIVIMVSTATISNAVYSPNTMDMLQDRAKISLDFMMRERQKCAMEKVCTHDDLEVELVCGTDGRTYNSVCEIKKAVCYGNPVAVQEKGHCPEKSKCGLEKSFQLRLAAMRNNSNDVFVPECDNDGIYSPVQCHKSTRFCWCVTMKDGRPIPGTAVQFKKPICLHSGKVGRRSSRRRLGRRNRGCSTGDRSTFNANLINIFRSEYDRAPRIKHRYAHNGNGLTDSLEQRIIKWKFDLLDRNGNGWLSKKEIRGLKRLVRKVVEPRACARQFTHVCDQNDDHKIHKREWFLCLGIDISMSHQILLSLNAATRNRLAKSTFRVDRSPGVPMDIQSDQGSGLDVLQQASSQFTLKEDEGEHAMKHDGAQVAGFPDQQGGGDLPDCFTHRNQVLQEYRDNPKSAPFLYDCQQDNQLLYVPVQCHRVSQFCWCVDVVTSRPVPNTSTKFIKPACPSNKPQRKSQFIKGCKPRKQDKFYGRLFLTMESNMIASGGAQLTDSMSRKEQAARWQFKQLDKNNNRVLQRREWKKFRKQLKQWHGVKRCGRNLIKFCDVDENKDLSLHEWLQCTVEMNVGTKSIKPLIRLEGKNPFTHILDPNQSSLD